MQLQTLFVAAMASVAVAGPMDKAVGKNWTFTDVKRVCNDADTKCTWSFGIDATTSYPKIEDRMPISCEHIVRGAGASKNVASGESKCGFFTVSSGWNAGGWTTLSVRDTPKNWIAYPSFEDTKVNKGKEVSPDRSFPVQNIN